MKTLIASVDSDIGKALYENIPNATGTSRRQEGFLYLDIDEGFPQFDSFDEVYYTIGVGGTKPIEDMMRINATNSYAFLDHIAKYVTSGGRINVLSSIAGSLQSNLDINIGANVYYKMSKAALNMGVIQLSQKHRHLNWTIIHPGFVNTKMTQGKNAPMEPDQCARKILSLPKLQGLNFLHVNGNTIHW